MPDPVTAVVGGAASIGGSLISGSATQSAGAQAAEATTESAQISADLLREQNEIARQILQPFVEIGTGTEERGGTIQATLDLLGLGDEGAQEAAIQAIQAGPEFAETVRQGEEAILANASATGGLRGGNVQEALAEFRPSVLNNLINQRFSRLGGLTQLAQSAAAGQASGTISTGTSAANILASGGQQAANILGQTQGAVGQNIGGSLTDLGGLFVGSKLF